MVSGNHRTSLCKRVHYVPFPLYRANIAMVHPPCPAKASPPTRYPALEVALGTEATRGPANYPNQRFGERETFI